MSKVNKLKDNNISIKTIGFIGTAQIGGSLARLSVKAGFNVVLSNTRDPKRLDPFIKELGPLASAATIAEAIAAADLVVAAIPFPVYKSLPADLLAGKIVIETLNYYPLCGFNIQALDENKFTSSELVQQHLIESDVVKAFHNIGYPHISLHARPAGDPERTTVPIAGDDDDAKVLVEQFINAIGYDTVDAGSLAESWRIEPGTPIYYWPYAPPVPEGISEDEARELYLTQKVEPLRPEGALALIAETERQFPVGGRLDILPPIHLTINGEYANNRY